MTTHSPAEIIPDDGELLDTWKRQHSSAAFEELVRRHMAMVHGVVLRRTSQPALAADITQIVFTLLARKAAGLHGGPLAPWLHRAAVMETAKALRTEGRHRRKLAAYAFHCETGCNEAPADSRESLLPRIDAAVDALPERFRRVLVLRFYEGLTFREIAVRTGESEASVQRRGHRALGRLEKTLRAACGGALAGIGHAASTSVPALVPGTIASRALAGASTPPAFSAFIHTMHPAALMASTATLTALLLSIPLTLQARRAGDAERRLSLALAALPGPHGKIPSPAVVTTPPTPGALSLPDAQSKRREDARTYAAKSAAEEERRIMDRLKQRFQFTPDQEKAVAAWHAQSRPLRETFIEKRRLRENYDPAFFAVEYGFHPDIPPQLQSLLTPGQQQISLQWEEARRTNYTEGWSSSELSFLADPLELTAAQKDEVYAKLHGIWSAYSAEDLSTLQTPAAIAARMDANHQTRAEAFAAILSPAQFARWEKLSLDWNRDFVKRYETPQVN
jgi:RNA polymerase sigma factor (sigma-70 family)